MIERYAKLIQYKLFIDFSNLYNLGKFQIEIIKIDATI